VVLSANQRVTAVAVLEQYTANCRKALNYFRAHQALVADAEGE
jgi:hypothetical protein